MTLPAPHAANVPRRERQLFPARSPPPPRLGAVRGGPYPSADLNAGLSLAPRGGDPPSLEPLLIPRPSTRAWMRVNEWVGMYVCTAFPAPSASRTPLLGMLASPNYPYKY